MLRGERVILRPTEREDMKHYRDLGRNVDLVLLGDGEWQPVPLAAFEKEFDKRLDDEDRAWFMIEVAGTTIGGCGLHHRDRRSGSTAFGIGIQHPEYVGKGYGSDSIRTLLRWAFVTQNWRRVWLDTMDCNERAIRCYQALGFIEEGRLRRQHFFEGRYVDMVQMGMLRREWEARYSA